MLSADEIEKWRDQLVRKRLTCTTKCDAAIDAGNCEGYCGEALILTMVLNGKSLYDEKYDAKPPEGS